MEASATGPSGVSEVIRAACAYGDKAVAEVVVAAAASAAERSSTLNLVTLALSSSVQARRVPARAAAASGGGAAGSDSTWFQERAAVVEFQFRGEGQRHLRAAGNARSDLGVHSPLSSVLPASGTNPLSVRSEEVATGPRPGKARGPEAIF